MSYQRPYQQQKRQRVEYEIEGYTQDNSILLTPDIKFEAESGLYSPVIEKVQISLDPEDKDIYPADRKKPDGKLRLHSKALERIGVAANILWDTTNCGPIHYVAGKEITYRAVGGLQKADGKVEMIAQYFEYNLEVVRDDLQAQYQEKDAWKVDRDFRQKRKFMVAYAESMARARVIRKLLNIKQEYTPQELQKPFVLVRFRMNIDYTDPEIKMLAAKAHILASVGIFGSPDATRLSAPVPPMITQAEKEILDEEKPIITRKFFEGLQRDDQISELNKLMKVKGYDEGQLSMPVKDFPDNHLLGFFDVLAKMPDQYIPY